MHSGESLALAAVAATAELELIRTRMRATLALLDKALDDRPHLHAVPDPEPTQPTPEQTSAGGSVLLFQNLRDQAEGVGE